MQQNNMVFINVTTETKLSVQLELPNTSISFTAGDESFIEEIMNFINDTRDKDSADLSIEGNLDVLDLSEKLSIPVVLSKDPEIENRYLLQLRFSESSFILHALSTEEIESLLVAFKDAEIQLGTN